MYDMDTVKEIRQVLETITDFKREAVSVQEVMDDLQILKLLCEKNMKSTNRTLYEKLISNFHFTARLLSRINALFAETSGTQGAVKENFKALVYKTLEDITLRIGIEAASSSALTSFTNIVSFLLDRIAEFSYVRGAKFTQSIFYANTCSRLREDLWEMVERNEKITRITFQEARELKEKISYIVDTVGRAESPEVFIHFYACLSYVYLLSALAALNEYEKFGI